MKLTKVIWRLDEVDIDPNTWLDHYTYFTVVLQFDNDQMISAKLSGAKFNHFHEFFPGIHKEVVSRVIK